MFEYAASGLPRLSGLRIWILGMGSSTAARVIASKFLFYRASGRKTGFHFSWTRSRLGARARLPARFEFLAGVEFVLKRAIDDIKNPPRA